MQLTDQQWAEFERRGWTVQPLDDHVWLYRGNTRVRIGDGEMAFKDQGFCHEIEAEEVFEVAAILGIAPPGYRLVPEEVAEAWLAERKAQAEQLAGPYRQCPQCSEIHLLPSETSEVGTCPYCALASALQGEVEKRHG